MMPMVCKRSAAALRAAWIVAACAWSMSGPALAEDAMQRGRLLFLGGAAPACAICHTLADAGAAGAIGPVLDELKPDAARVEKAVRNGLGVMPAYKTLTDEQVQSIAHYVATATGGAKQ